MLRAEKEHLEGERGALRRARLESVPGWGRRFHWAFEAARWASSPRRVRRTPEAAC